MSPYQVDLTDIAEELGGSIVLDDDVSLDDIHVGATVFVSVKPGHVSATLTNAGDSVMLYGTVTAAFDTECVRCLETFTLHVEANLEGLYMAAENAAETSEDQEWEPLPANGIIDLLPAIDAALRLELPFAPLHAQDCAGICPTCGVNVNETECSCPDDEVEPGPFDALKSLFPEQGDELHTPD